MRQLFFCWIILLHSAFCFSQTYRKNVTLKSFEGNTVILTIKDTIRGRVLKISCPTDKIFLSDYIGTVESVKILSNKFLKIVYDVRGGTGVQLRNTAILAISKGRITPSLLINSYAHSIYPDYKNLSLLDGEGHFYIKVDVKEDSKSEYKVLAVIHDKQTSKSNSKENYNISKQFVLSFDTTHRIFYNTHLNLPKQILVSNFNTKATPLYVKGIVPAIDLGKPNLYYYINGAWYLRGYRDVFYQDYFK
jgi:hypothetical protein